MPHFCSAVIVRCVACPLRAVGERLVVHRQLLRLFLAVKDAHGALSAFLHYCPLVRACPPLVRNAELVDADGGLRAFAAARRSYSCLAASCGMGDSPSAFFSVVFSILVPSFWRLSKELPLFRRPRAAVPQGDGRHGGSRPA